MLKGIDGYWMRIIAPGYFTQWFTLGRLPLGTNVYASISLSEVNTSFAHNNPNPKFVAQAYVASWTFYKPDGTESEPEQGIQGVQNAIAVENCATIKFALIGEQVAAIAQINVITFEDGPGMAMAMTSVFFDVRSGQILSVHHGAKDGKEARRSGQYHTEHHGQHDLKTSEEHVGMITVPSGALGQGKQYKVDVSRKALIETEDKDGVGFGFGGTGRSIGSKALGSD